MRTAREAERTELAAVTDGRGCAQAVGHARQHIGAAPETHISRICRDWPTCCAGTTHCWQSCSQVALQWLVEHCARMQPPHSVMHVEYGGAEQMYLWPVPAQMWARSDPICSESRRRCGLYRHTSCRRTSGASALPRAASTALVPGNAGCASSTSNRSSPGADVESPGTIQTESAQNVGEQTSPGGH